MSSQYPDSSSSSNECIDGRSEPSLQPLTQLKQLRAKLVAAQARELGNDYNEINRRRTITDLQLAIAAIVKRFPVCSIMLHEPARATEVCDEANEDEQQAAKRLVIGPRHMSNKNSRHFG